MSDSNSQQQAGNPQGGAPRRWLFGALMLLLVAAGVEIGSRVILWGALGESLADLAARRSGLILEPGEGAPGYRYERDIQGFDNEVLHPFLGFVFDPAANERERRRENDMLEITRLGFFRLPGERPSYEGADTQIGVFGGSVAMLFAFQGREVLSERLGAAHPELGRLGVRSFALGGHKQPQALLTLNYLLALGERVDIVVNLDGFNELALSWFDNYQQRIFPPYPRAWRRRVEGIPSRSLLRLLARQDSVRRLRSSLAQAFETPGVRSVAAAQIVWLSVDRQLAAAHAELQAAAQSAPSGGEDYSLQGPFAPVESREELLRSLVDLWKRSSLQMHRLAEANGMVYCHALQPNQYDLGSKPLSTEEREKAYSIESPYREIIELGYPLLRRAGEEIRAQGACFLDLSRAFEAVESTLYVDDCCHFGPGGNERLAEALADAVSERLERRGAAQRREAP
ncbi:MAG: hypothetical protein AAF725_26955 [Acidobacteriota bacterium]